MDEKTIISKLTKNTTSFKTTTISIKEVKVAKIKRNGYESGENEGKNIKKQTPGTAPQVRRRPRMS